MIQLKSALSFCFVLFLISGLPNSASGQIEVGVEITKDAHLKTDILVKMLDVLSGGMDSVEAADLLEKVINTDLVYSGLIRTGLSEDQSDTLDFLFTIEGTVEGPLRDAEVTGEDAPTTINLNFMTWPSRQLIFSKRYRPLPNQLRTTAHHFSKQVIEYISQSPAITMTKVAFCRGSDARTDLYVVDYDGAGEMKLTANRSLNLCPSWSPDGFEIAFTSYRDGSQGLYSLNTQNGSVRPIIELDGLNYGADWHPDGHELLLALSRGGNPEIYRISPEGRIIKRLTVAKSIEISPSYAPNGRDLVFTSDRTGTPQLYIIDNEGTGRRRRTYEGRYNDSADWSPDGKNIVYTTRSGNQNQIVLMEASGENRRVLTQGHWGNCEDPSWAPDGRHIVFTSDRTGVFKLFVYDVAENNFRQLTFGQSPDTTPAWSK
jgi:tol-pal system beta propeller repeat protein TolB